MGYKIELGKRGEERAVEFIISKNFKILEQNFRYKKYGEIDIIAQKGNLILFIEVKKRSSSLYGGALYSIGSRKRRSLRLVANGYLNSHYIFSSDQVICRFDMIAIEDNRLEWIQDIFR